MVCNRLTFYSVYVSIELSGSINHRQPWKGVSVTSENAAKLVALISKAKEALAMSRQQIVEAQHTVKALEWFIAHGADPEVLPRLEQFLRNHLKNDFDKKGLATAEKALEALIAEDKAQAETIEEVTTITLPTQLVDLLSIVVTGSPNDPRVVALLDPENRDPLSFFMRKLEVARIITRDAGKTFSPKALLSANEGESCRGISLLDIENCTAAMISVAKRIVTIRTEE